MEKHWSQDKYIEAFKFAARAHQGQKVPGTDLPYIMHLSLVGMEVIAALRNSKGYNENLAIQCALLHVEIVVLEYDEVSHREGKVLTPNTIFKPWDWGEGWPRNDIPITIGAENTEFDWGVSSLYGYFMKWDDFHTKCEVGERIQDINIWTRKPRNY
jgi:hypothetical protein